mmetsp:Transcript_29873/g.45671  ORF Transcript_29873/g.45671 Transcript_29873/m.45671 type:complete len:108 (+) Transcript_29873:3941-4264(+)
MAEICSKAQLSQIINAVNQDPFDVCRSPHGTRSIQKLIEIVREQDHFDQIKALLSTIIKELSWDINGNHVIQKILKSWSTQNSQFIFDAMSAQCVKIACHKHGCCIM